MNCVVNINLVVADMSVEAFNIHIYGVTSSSSGLYIWRGEKCDCCS